MTARYTAIGPDGVDVEPDEDCLHCKIALVVQEHAEDHETNYNDVAAAMLQCLAEVIASAESDEERARLTARATEMLPAAVREALAAFVRHEKRMVS